MRYKDEVLRLAAKEWLKLSAVASAPLGNNLDAVLMGAILFSSDKPVSIRKLSQHPFVRSRRNATRWVEKMETLGVVQRTDEGIITTELGKETGRYYFGSLLNLEQIIKTTQTHSTQE